LELHPHNLRNLKKVFLHFQSADTK